MSDIVISVEQDDVPHNGESITKLELSPNGRYLVTHSENDRSIVGWNVKDTDKGPKINDEISKKTNGTEVVREQLKPDTAVKTIKINSKYKIKQVCVSDNKKLACIYTHKNRNFLSK
jgi:WD40 repeat protein